MIKKPVYLIIIILSCIALISFVNSKEKKNIVGTIILDAGHGGSDPGANCYSRSCTEAGITLGVTLKLGKELEKNIPGLKIYYTRKDDTYPSLIYRADFANQKKGDLFVSIHCNSAGSLTRKEPNGTKTVVYYVGKGKKKKKMTKEVPQFKYVKYPNPAKGMETYVWETSKTGQKTDAIAAKENAEIFNDPEYKTKYGDGVDINSTEFIAKAKLRTKKYFTRSTILANMIQEEGANVGRNDRSVKQRGVGIWVLQATAMPSVLVETGYISNPEEEKYLNSQSGQQEMAELIAKAIKKYKEEMEKNNPATPTPATSSLQHDFIKPDEISI